jgi:hypothetical protein
VHLFGAGHNKIMRIVSAVASFRYVESPELQEFRSAISERRLDEFRADDSRDAEQLLEELVKSEDTAADLTALLQDMGAENRNLKANLIAVSAYDDAEPEPAAADLIEASTDDLDNVVDAVRFSQKQLGDLIVLDSALESAEESPFRDAVKVHAALRAIDSVASLWAESQGTGGTGVSWKDQFERRCFNYKPKISQTARTKWGQEFTFSYEGNQSLFEEHLTMGIGQPDKCLSIHFSRDEAKGNLIVGHVGRHLRNTTT